MTEISFGFTLAIYSIVIPGSLDPGMHFCLEVKRLIDLNTFWIMYYNYNIQCLPLLALRHNMFVTTVVLWVDNRSAAWAGTRGLYNVAGYLLSKQQLLVNSTLCGLYLEREIHQKIRYKKIVGLLEYQARTILARWWHLKLTVLKCNTK